MNAVGRHVPRSVAATQHQRRSTDSFLDATFNGKWHQSSDFVSWQDFGFYGGSKMSKISPDIFSPNELVPGLLDLHSFDTELLTEVPDQYEANAFQQPVNAKAFDDTERYVAANGVANSTRCHPDNNLHKSISTDKERASNVAKIKVVVRKRPLNKKEIAKKEQDIITIEPNANALTVHETKLKVDLTEYVERHGFVFDAVLDEDVSNDEVYSETVAPIVPLIFQRTKATCFAYGQTGSGKTYTMQPLPIKASQDILRLMYYTYRDQGFQLLVSFFEIYGGKVFDLLNDRKKLCMREDGRQQVCIVGLQEYRVSDVEFIKELIEKGNATRMTGTTGANEESSRSHAILQLAIRKSVGGNESKPPRPVGKLSFIDLAGSERGADTTDNDKQTRMEGAEINKSLLALKECIRALDNDQGHIPFRGSKLTEVLRDSFVGDSRTVMISCISPSSGSCEHTLNTLRYADRVKSLSKGSSKRDLLSSSNLRDSTALPLPSTLSAESNNENSIFNAPCERNRFGWSRDPKTIRETSPPFPSELVPGGRMERSVAASVYSDYSNFMQASRTDNSEDDLDHSWVSHEHNKPSLSYNARGESRRVLTLNDKRKTDKPVKPRKLPSFDVQNSFSDKDLEVLLKEEEDLISFHRRQVQETMEIVREEMNLLFEVDQPGNHVDDYITKLGTILSWKAASISELQGQLARFQKRLLELDVAAPSST